MVLIPDKKLFTKNILTLLTLSIVVFIAFQIITYLLGFDSDIRNIEKSKMIFYMIGKILIVLMWIISTPLIYLWIKALSYEIGDNKITIYKGFISKTEQNIPFSKVTDFALYRSLYDRLLGIGTIKIQTAGQGANQTGYEGYLSGLTNWKAIHLELKTSLSQESSTKPFIQKEDINISILNELIKIREILEEK
ncbi:MAG: PH domain-containing protein [Candidatus Cloacimonadota bacterium]|nr:PH domain-containing protein [Candidatus Cloacimonadota bacterium]